MDSRVGMELADPSPRSNAMMRMSWSRSNSDTRMVRLSVHVRSSEKRSTSNSPNVSRCEPWPDTILLNTSSATSEVPHT